MPTRDILLDAFGRISDEVHAVGEGLDEAGLAYRPDGDANSIAWLLWHLTRVQDDHVSELAGIDQAYVAGGWAERLGMTPDTSDVGYGHTPEQVARVRFPTPDVLLGYFDAVYARTGEYLARLDAEELERIVDHRWDPPVTAAVRLVSVISDCLQHVGQAAYVRGLYGRLG